MKEEYKEPIISQLDNLNSRFIDECDNIEKLLISIQNKIDDIYHETNDKLTPNGLEMNKLQTPVTYIDKFNIIVGKLNLFSEKLYKLDSQLSKIV